MPRKIKNIQQFLENTNERNSCFNMNFGNSIFLCQNFHLCERFFLHLALSPTEHCTSVMRPSPQTPDSDRYRLKLSQNIQNLAKFLTEFNIKFSGFQTRLFNSRATRPYTVDFKKSKLPGFVGLQK